MNFMKKKNIIQLSIISVTVIALIISIFFDNRVNEKILKFHTPFFDSFFAVISNFYLLIFVLFILTSVLMYVEKKREGILPLWVSLFATLVIVTVLKLLIARERPLPEIDFSLIAYSFPSLHAAVSFAVVPILDREFPRLKYLWVIIGILVAISRVYLQLHYLSDVIAGALIGYIIGITTYYFNQKYFYKIKW